MPKGTCLLVLLFGVSCGGSGPASPSGSTSQVTLRGKVTDTVSGQPVAANIDVTGIGIAQSDASGSFAVTTPGTVPSSRVTITTPGYHARTTIVQWASEPTIDVIPDRAPFDLVFFRQFVRNTYEAPDTFGVLRRWTRPPMIYLKTADEAGEPIPLAQLDSTEAALINSAASLTGGRFGLAGLERGAATRLGQTGWITVVWLATDEGDFCGLAGVAVDGGRIALNYKNGGGCVCGSLAIRPRTVKHELGHAMGFWHTDSLADLMSGRAVSGCEAQLSPRELFHAAIAYSREPGNRDIDVEDSRASPLSMRWPGVEVVD